MEVHLYLTRRYILGISENTTVPENAFLSLFSPEAIWCVSQKDCFAVSLQRDGFEEDVSSTRDGCTAWVKSDPETNLNRHLVDSKGIYPAHSEAPARKHSPSSSGYHFNFNTPNRSTEQTRISYYNWNSGPRRGKAGAIKSHIAVKWHIITLQEAIEYLEHDFLMNRYVTHYGGCAILFNKDTFFSDIKVSSFYLHDTRTCDKYKIIEGETGWVMQGVVSKAAFRLQPRNGQQTFSLHINNNFAKKRGIGKKLSLTIRSIMQDEHVNLGAGDFNGAAWRQTSGDNRHPTSTLEEAFADTNFPMPPGPTHCCV